mmetsp:Transcript_27451/g.44199  ORF Transcript_27451/g.44199 Transcript_27451/m.44199 type:complete len:157 (-) Transcript_27451:901-1371(-)
MITKAADKIEALVEQAFREKMTEQNYERLHLIIENEDGKVRKTDFLEKFYKAQKDFIDEDEISEQMIEELIPPLQEDILAVVQAELNQKSKNSERNSSGNLIAETTTAQQEDAGFMDVDIDKKAEALLSFMINDASETALSKIQDKEYIERYLNLK